MSRSMRSSRGCRSLAMAGGSEPGKALGQKREETVTVDVADPERIPGPPRYAPPVGDGHAPGESALEFDLDIDPPSAEQVGAQQIADHQRIMQRCALRAVFLHVEPFEEIGPARHDIA